jgi:hypothetical protein
MNIDNVANFRPDGTVEPSAKDFDPRYSDTYLFPVNRGPDGITRVFLPGPVMMRIRVINQCSWPQQVQWKGDRDVVAPRDAMQFRHQPTTVGREPLEPEVLEDRFDHRATRVVNGKTVTCKGSANPSWILQWAAPPPNLLPTSPFGLDPIDVVLTESSDGDPTTEVPTQPLDPTPPATGLTIDDVANFNPDGTVALSAKHFDPRYSDTYLFPVNRGPDGTTRIILGGDVTMRIRVINKCSWPQQVRWEGDSDVVAPADRKQFRHRATTVGRFASEAEVLESRFDHRATRAVNGKTVTCEGRAEPSWIIEWAARPPNFSPTSPFGLDPVDVVLTESSGGGTTTNGPTPTSPLNPTPPTVGFTGVGGLTDCFGDNCVALDSCTAGACGDVPTWSPVLPDGWDSGFQVIGAEAIRIRIEASRQASLPRRELNALGLLAKSFGQFLEWWRPTLHAAEALTQSSVQKGLQFLITSQGGSTGKNLTMQVLNFTGRPVELQGMLALEPLKKDAQQKVSQAFAGLAGRHLPAKVDLNGYCLEFLKLPPVAGQIMRVAGPEVQKRFEPVKKIMAAANRLTSQGALKPDSTPAGYADSIKQWAIWTAEQRFNEKRFGEAFLGHTKKNVEAAGQKWSKQIEDVVRQRTPNRWQDIVQVLTAAGAAVPK